MLGWIIGIGIVVTSALVVGQARGLYAFQYAFFLRFQVFAAVALLFLWVPVTGPAKDLLGNLFVLTPSQLCIVGFISVFTAWSIAFWSLRAYIAIPRRNELSFVEGRSWRDANPLRPWIKDRFVYLALVLAAPLWVALLWNADAALLAAAVHLAAGVGAAVLVFVVVNWTHAAEKLEKRDDVGRLLAKAVGMVPVAQEHLKRMHEKASIGYEELVVGGFTEAKTRNFFILSGIGYVLLGVLGVPDSNAWIALPEGSVPALAYVLVLLSLAVQAFSYLALLLDRARVPVFVAVCFLTLIVAKSCGTDHYFAVRDAPAGAAEKRPEPLTPGDVVRAWAGRHPRDECPALVVVTASGGGIAASEWTGKVLHALSTDQVLNPRPDERRPFADSIVLVSTVSGGGVGAMYFVDAYCADRPIATRVLDDALESAGRSSLDAAAWGIAYADLFRAFAPGLVWPTMDRGAALERRWRRHWRPANPPTIGSWRKGVVEGWRPAQAFNGTVLETGALFRVAPYDDPENPIGATDGALCFRSTHRDADIGVVTSARLSATFPFVTPAARPRSREGPLTPAYHVADGGYYDNLGTVTAVRFLTSAMPALQALASEEGGARRVVVVDVRVTDVTAEKGEPGKPEEGWLNEMAGPLLTMLRVRGSAQTVRTGVEFDLLRDAFKFAGIEFETVRFETAMRTPLSWHLTAAETKAIKAAWDSDENGRRLSELRRAMRRGP